MQSLANQGAVAESKEYAMRRRELLAGTLAITAATAAAAKSPARAAAPIATKAVGNNVYVAVTGSDANAGTKQAPLLTIAEAARRISAMEGTEPVTVILSEGVHAIGEEAHFTPKRRKFTRTERLTIQAEVLPDDPEWHFGRMPTLIHTLPLKAEWNGIPIPNGKTANGIVVGTSHVTIRGLKVLGAPVVETPAKGEVNRIYPIGRFDGTLDDLEISQCFFGGDEVTAPNHLPIIANGSGMNIHHCIFYRTKLAMVYWHVGSKGHAMRNCIVYGCYQGGPWTAMIANDFDFRNNVVAHCKNAWVQHEMGSVDRDAAAGVPGANGRPFAGSPGPSDGKYRIVDSLFAHNDRIAVSGTGSNLGFSDSNADFLTFSNTRVTDDPVRLIMDEWDRRYLHPLPGSEAAAIGAGLFMR